MENINEYEKMIFENHLKEVEEHAREKELESERINSKARVRVRVRNINEDNN